LKIGPQLVRNGPGILHLLAQPSYFMMKGADVNSVLENLNRM